MNMKTIGATKKFDRKDYSNWIKSVAIEGSENLKQAKAHVPVLKELLGILTTNCGQHHPELICIREKFNILSEELLLLVKKEGVFSARQSKGITLDELNFIKALLRDIRLLTNSYSLSAENCPTYPIAYERLQNFDRQLSTYLIWRVSNFSDK